VPAPMQVRATTDPPLQTGADTICVGLVEGEAVAHDVAGGALGALVESGEARTAPRKVAVAHAEGARWLLVGLGAREQLDAEGARVAAAVAEGRARELRAQALCWELPHHVDDAFAAGLVEGTLLSGYRFDRFKSTPDPEDEAPDGLASLVISAHHDVAAPVEAAAVVAAAQNAARDLQNTPANELTPTRLAVTFDTGGISIKPAAKMAEMKFDMSGGAAVLEAVGAIARLRLPVRVVAVIGATENMPSGHAVKPGDIVRARNGTTIEVNNTDAEGRLVLSDCLAWAVEQGAERLVDLATLTGAIIVALGSTHAGLFANDDDWAGAVEGAARTSGELVWRLPLHPEYAEMIKGRYADIVNATEARKASSITAAEFLKRFVGNVPWAHVDIAGTAWDLERPYARKGGSGFGVRLLVDLAQGVAAG
jgi:leucyl aminopeptidase